MTFSFSYYYYCLLVQVIGFRKKKGTDNKPPYYNI